EIDVAADGHPPGLPPLLSSQRYRKLNCEAIGLSVRPIYRDSDSGQVFPTVLRMLRRGVGRALKHTFFSFAQSHSNVTPQHFYSLGRRAMVKAVWDVDRRLAEICDSFDFLLQVTPVNAEAAWREFQKSKYQRIPRFYYRPLAVEPATLKRRLYSVPIEAIEDPTLAQLFRQRQDELDRKITMLSDIGTSRFLQGSLQVYGGVAQPLLDVGLNLVSHIAPRARDDLRQGQIDAESFAQYARAEIEAYRCQYPGFAATVNVRKDMFSGLLCSNGNLLIGKQTKIPTSRIRALLQHEVGTHLLTYYNGLAAPFRQLHSGFAGYDAMQEGLAVLSEYLVGGMSRPRMRLLGARVVAAAQLVAGATFIETFRLLNRDYAFSQRVAYTIAMRTFRGGGLTKDMVYLRGLIEMLEYLGSGGDLEPLLVGKIASDHIPLIQELQLRHVLKKPPLRPHYLSDPQVIARLEHVRNGLTVFDLIEGKNQ
ncbi:MAG TPA: tyrosine/phenylalanine carboxypeptidase domain-containing protein, partial [Thermoguttaceae bacterium]|nr:tyrosine/phenylalanine carboxypeptidase domain-containing protein [Thermoguttaceae bacterium]